MTNNSRNSTPRVGRLDTLLQIRREMTRVYRAARRNDLDLQELRTFIYALQSLSSVVRDTDLTARLDTIEGVVGRLGTRTTVTSGNVGPAWTGTRREVERTKPVQN